MTVSTFIRADLLPCAGLVVGGALWALNMQLGQIIPYVECGASLPYAALASFPAALLSLAAGLLSWHGTRPRNGAAWREGAAYPRSLDFVAGVSALSSLLFAFALVMQGLSSLILTGCER